ncbi:MAG: PAS domain-containing sensor histidine kinase [Lentimicrobiaceae bacterium]|jgi:PAS domain S-box-containing protein
MRAKYNIEPQDETEVLNQKNKSLRKELDEVSKAYKQIKAWNIDALVKSNEKGLNVYTDKTADKPYRILIEKMHEGAVTLNEDGIILYCNSYFAKLMNLSLQKILGTNFEKFINASSREHFASLLKSRANAFKEELYLYAADSKKIPVLMTINSFLLENISVVSIIFTDLTIQKESQKALESRTTQLEHKNRALNKANEELAFQIGEKEKRETELHAANKELKHLLQLNADKDLFMSILAHDLRSPFNGLLGLSELLIESIHESDVELTENLANHINISAQNAFTLLEDLLMWTRSQSGKIPYERQKLNFTDLCTTIIETIFPNPDSKNIKVNFAKTEDIIVFADIDMLKTVLRNLISNAVKFTNPGGKIDVSANQDKANVTITVTDNGTGMNPETVNKLFDGKLHSTKGTANESGTGLGLFLCKEFVKKHGGKIWAESIEGKGSSFYFTLPVEKSMDKPDTSDKI